MPERKTREDKLREAFEQAPTVMRFEQVKAIELLLVEGKHAGTTLPNADPIPGMVAVAGTGLRTEKGKTLALLDADGRSWSVTPDGVCWPSTVTYEQALRARV